MIDGRISGWMMTLRAGARGFGRRLAWAMIGILAAALILALALA